MAQVFVLLSLTSQPSFSNPPKNKKNWQLFKISPPDATFWDFWRLILQNHFKDTPREAAAAKPKLLLFFLALFAPNSRSLRRSVTG